MVQIIERKPIERKPNELTTIPLFRNLFPRDEAMIEKIADHMKANGYDDSQPIICWERAGENGLLAHVVVDGHTRLAAARRANLDNVKIMFKDFADDDEALQYAIHNQRDRRNITDADLFKCIEAVDQLKKKGGDKKSEKSKASSGAIEQGKSSKATAKIVGTSPRKVEKVRRILKKANRETVEAVKSGKKSINAACQETNTVPERITEHDPDLFPFLDEFIMKIVALPFIKNSVNLSVISSVKLKGAKRKARCEAEPPRALTPEEQENWALYFKARRAEWVCNLLCGHLQDLLPPEVNIEEE